MKHMHTQKHAENQRLRCGKEEIQAVQIEQDVAYSRHITLLLLLLAACCREV